MSFNVIVAQHSHSQGILQVEQQCFSQPWGINGINAEIEKETAVMLVAVDANNAVIGWAGFEYIFGEGSITNVAVLPQNRKKGVAQQLVATLIEKAQQLTLESLMLEVRESNTAAICLYKKLGFVEIGTRPKFYQQPVETAILMKKNF